MLSQVQRCFLIIHFLQSRYSAFLTGHPESESSSIEIVRIGTDPMVSQFHYKKYILYRRSLSDLQSKNGCEQWAETLLLTYKVQSKSGSLSFKNSHPHSFTLCPRNSFLFYDGLVISLEDSPGCSFTSLCKSASLKIGTWAWTLK